MVWNLPNQLTVARLFLAAGFFVLVGLYDPASAAGTGILLGALAVFVLAVLTDVLDGHLARKWQQITAFGRLVDPFVDKLLVMGAFIMLAGPNFAFHPANTGQAELDLPGWLTGGMATAVQPWMVVVMLAREFIVSAIRGYSESQGIQFAATQAGKIKMLLQSASIIAVLGVLAVAPKVTILVYGKIALVWLAMFATAFSGYYYVRRARGLFTEAGNDS